MLIPMTTRVSILGAVVRNGGFHYQLAVEEPQIVIHIWLIAISSCRETLKL
jgi:hypothetical protein